MLAKLLNLLPARGESAVASARLPDGQVIPGNSYISLPLVQISPTQVGRQSYTVYIRQELTFLYPITVSWEGGQGRLVLLHAETLAIQPSRQEARER